MKLNNGLLIILLAVLTGCAPPPKPHPISGTITYKVASTQVNSSLCSYTTVLPPNSSYPAEIHPNTKTHYSFMPDQLGVPYYLIYSVASPYREPYCIFHFRENRLGKIYVQSRANDTNIRCEVVGKYDLEVTYLSPYNPYFPTWGCY